MTPATGPNGGGLLAADSSVLNTSASHVDDTNSNISAQLTHIRGIVDQLAAGTWHGSAANAFSRVMTDWDSAVIRLNSALAGIAEQLRANSTSYANEEDANAAAISRAGGAVAAGPLNIT